MDDETHVGLVDTHAKGDGSHDDVNLLHQEVILRLRAERAVETGMIGRRLDVIGFQHLSQFLNLLARKTIDDATLARMLLDELDDVLIHVMRLRTHLIIQVGTVKRRFELHSIHNAQILLDVSTYLVCSGCSQCNDWSLAYLVDNRTDATVLRTEIVPPLRDTVGLVNGVE